METKHIIIILAVLILGFVLGLLFNKFALTANVVANTNISSYTYTTALCNNQKECMDVLVSCENGETTSVEAISHVLKNSENWSDPRNVSDSLC